MGFPTYCVTGYRTSIYIVHSEITQLQQSVYARRFIANPIKYQYHLALLIFQSVVTRWGYSEKAFQIIIRWRRNHADVKQKEESHAHSLVQGCCVWRTSLGQLGIKRQRPSRASQISEQVNEKFPCTLSSIWNGLLALRRCWYH